MTKRSVALVGAVALAGVAFARDAEFASAPYMNPKLSVDERLEDLVSRMTVAEKAAALSTTCGFTMYEIVDGKVRPTEKFRQICREYPGCGLGSCFRADWFSGRNWKTGIRPNMLIQAYNTLQRFAIENTRLGIPLALGGSQILGETTIPSGPGIASTFDVELAREAARMNIRERRTFSPNFGVGFPQVTLALDPRWSRVEQTYGEDPFLAAEMAYARCAGSRDLGGTSAVESFICHFYYGGPEIALRPENPWQQDALKVHDAIVAYVRNPTDANWAAIQPLRAPKHHRVVIRAAK